MRMKRFVSLLLVSLLMAGCVAETNDPVNSPADPPSTVESEPAEEVEPPAESHAEEIEIPTESAVEEQAARLPSLPDFSTMPRTELPFDMSNRGEPLEVSYVSTPADDAFLNELAALEEQILVSYTSDGNFFWIGDCLLYYTSDSSMGPSRLQIEYPDGSTQVLVDSVYGIQGLFIEDRETLCIEFTTLSHYEGGSAQFHFLNLLTGEVTEAGYGSTSRGHGFSHMVYRKHHYMFRNAKDAQDLGEADDISLQDESGEFTEIIQFAASANFIGDRIFYLGKGRQEVYTTDLSGQGNTLFHTFDAPIWSFGIDGDTLHYQDENGSYEVEVPNPYLTDAEAAATEFSRYERKDDVLYYTDETGESTPILANFQANLVAVKDDWLYIQTFWSTDINRYDYWKVKKDGTGLTQLN